ncbi:YbaK/EbsC family protein [Loigolactobacillus binensis]|uniref:YbaK/EbsC family protein n=1 Tax=Loigolactobacillus binensis TaxID=2559922 RepID=A0ABW3EAQ0_9LACO|nr:YbaK/EbsC family protein [Loigolactobacillus binensis]
MQLVFQSVTQQPDLVAAPVYQQLKALAITDQVQVAPIDPAYADGDLLSQHYAIPFAAELNCLIVQGKRQATVKYAALVVPYGHKANTGGVTKHALDVSKVSFAPLADVLAQTQMELGSITPLGLPSTWHVLIDPSVFEQPTVVIGSGRLNSKVQLPTTILRQLLNVQVVAGLAK